MLDAILALNVVTGPTIWTVFGLAIVAALYLLLRRPSRRWVATALLGVLGGAALGALVALVVDLTKPFGTPLPFVVNLWVIVTFAALGLAVVNLWRSRWWRKVIAVFSLLLFTLAGGLGINAHYGLNKTVASLFGATTEKPIDLPGDTATVPAKDAAKPLYERWQPPADMPSKGKTGTQVIPNTLSGFTSRPAGIYLPPAALVKNPPRLPFVLMMMGQPGNPDPQLIAEALDSFAAKNKGLAPIVVVADQLGDPNLDPACADSAKYGNAETFITKDVVDWAQQHLHILQDRKYWTIAGYSNGGGCALKYIAQNPSRWGNLLDISGEEYPGSEIVDSAIADVFNGDAGAFEAAKPSAILAAHPGAYSGITAVFTVGGNDPAFIPQVQRSADLAKTAGMDTTYYVVPGAGHVIDAINGGFAKGFDILYPRLGLAPPNGKARS